VSVPATAVGQPKKAAAAAWIGSALEYYDFFIYGSAAALIFPKVFFDDSDPATATLLSLATFGVAYAARPVGALFLGHFGDRVGRKKIMIFTLLLMGLSTFLIGCLPTRGAGRRRSRRSCSCCAGSSRASRRRASRPAPVP
jgi:MFS family permease